MDPNPTSNNKKNNNPGSENPFKKIHSKSHLLYILMLYNHRHKKDIDSLVNDEHSFRALMKKQTLVF